MTSETFTKVFKVEQCCFLRKTKTNKKLNYLFVDIMKFFMKLCVSVRGVVDKSAFEFYYKNHRNNDLKIEDRWGLG